MTREGRRLCADQPDGIPHLVDQPRAQRCDQHRAQRHRWSDANRYRTRERLPLLPWKPEPLTPDRRREALRLFADINATQIVETVQQIRGILTRLTELQPTMTAQARPRLEVGLARLDALSTTLLDIAATMGWPSYPRGVSDPDGVR